MCSRPVSYMCVEFSGTTYLMKEADLEVTFEGVTRRLFPGELGLECANHFDVVEFLEDATSWNHLRQLWMEYLLAEGLPEWLASLTTRQVLLVTERIPALACASDAPAPGDEIKTYTTRLCL